MSDRKQTPDILGSVLGAPNKPAHTPDILPTPVEKQPPAQPAEPRPAPATKARAKTAAKKSRAAKASTPAAGPVVWEYRDVMFYDYGGFVVRWLGGKEISDWKSRKAGMSEYINRLGSKGWELVSLVVPRRNHLLAVFKRPKQQS